MTADRDAFQAFNNLCGLGFLAVPVACVAIGTLAYLKISSLSEQGKTGEPAAAHVTTNQSGNVVSITVDMKAGEHVVLPPLPNLEAQKVEAEE